MNSIVVKAEEVEELRQLLAANSQRLEPPAWQRELLSPPSEWVASFLLPLYSGEGRGRADVRRGVLGFASSATTRPASEWRSGCTPPGPRRFLAEPGEGDGGSGAGWEAGRRGGLAHWHRPHPEPAAAAAAASRPEHV